MSINMKILSQAFAKTAAVIEKTVQTTVQEVTGPKALTDFELLNQIGSAGPGLVWKLFSAKPRGTGSSQYAAVCVWMVDKRAVSEARARAGVSKAVEDAFFDVLRGDAGRLVRIRHPGVVHVVQALDETKNSMAFVTEPLLASVANTLGDLSNVGGGDSVPKELKSAMEMGLLEVKHGLLQIAESLEFLHNNARLVHRAISPESVLITASGAWKLGGFGFAISSDQAGGSSNVQAFHYSEYDVEDSMLPLQPSLNYTAPELVRSKDSSGGHSSDIFSFGCLAYHLIARKPLLDCQNNVKMYMNTLNYLTSDAFSSIPPELVPDLQRMLSYNETTRPSALEFTGSPFFRDDTRLRALRFLDHMLGRDNMQKSEFLKALSDMWKDFDSRVLRYKVLPPLCAELRNVVIQPMILPMVLTIAESQDKHEFELSTLPALVPVINSAAGETLLLLVKHADLIINKTGQNDLVSHVLPMLVRAYDDTDPRIQEEVLKKTLGLTKHLDSRLVKQALLPRVHGLALKTTVAAVRVNSLICLGEMIHTLDKQAVLDVLQTIQRCTAVDRSQPTLMCTLSVANSVLKQYGTEFVAEHVLPLLSPLLITQQLSVQQFAKHMAFFKDILRKIEEKRGVSVSDSGIPEVQKYPGLGSQLEPSKEMNGTSSVSAVKKSSSWDEDWPSSQQKQAPSMNPSIKTPNGTRLANGVSPQSHSPLKAVNSDSQLMNSSPSIDIEWPPRTSTSAVPQRDDEAKKFADVDPFADWPPRTTNNNALNCTSGFSNNVNLQNNNVSNWASQNIQGSSGFDSLSFDNGFGLGQSMGSMKQNQNNFGAGGNYSSKKASDIGSIFASSKNDNNALRLAPPPSTAVGRGRGRGRGAHGQSGQTHKPPLDGPLLDLL